MAADGTGPPQVDQNATFVFASRTSVIVPNACIVVDASDAVVAMLAAGGGISIGAPFIAAPHVASGELVPVLSAFAVEQRNITALWPESPRANAAVCTFLTVLQDVFQERMRAATAASLPI